MKPFIFFYIASSFTLILLLSFLGNEYLTFASLASQLLSLCVVGIAFNEFRSQQQEELTDKITLADVIAYPFHCVEKIQIVQTRKVVIIILLGTLLLGLANAYLITERLDVDKNTDNIIRSISFASLGVTQFGGWFFQACVVYMLAVVLGGTLKFDIYLKLVGIAYVGFLILALFTLILNYFYIPTTIKPNDFNSLIENSLTHTIIGKMGELWVLTILAAGISVNEKFKASKGILTAILPSFLFLTFKHIFNIFI